MKAMLGLELLDRRVIAVVVDETGRVVERSEVADANLPAAAARALAAAVSAASTVPTALGIASHNPDAADCAAVVRALAPKYAGRFATDGAILAGTAAAVAEAWAGAGRGARDVVYFAVAEHAVAGLLRDGAPLIGAHRRAPVVSWLALNPVEREDYRKVGCLEAEVAGAGIVRRLVWRVKAGDSSRVQDAVAGDLGAITVEHVLDAARAGDGVAISVVRDTAKYLGMAAANLVVIADPARLVLGGIMATAKDLLLELVRVELARRLPPAMMSALTIVPAVLGGDAAAIGAARLSAAALQ